MTTLFPHPIMAMLMMLSDNDDEGDNDDGHNDDGDDVQGIRL